MTQPQGPPNSPIAEQIADLVVKVIKPGGVTGGTIGAFWFLFVQSDVPKAIASAAIGIALSYGAKLLQPIHRGNEQRMERIGEAANRGLDRMGEAAIARITSIEDRYFECQAADCETSRTEGMGKISGIFTPMLEQVFVPLELDCSTLLPGYRTAQPYNPEQLERAATIDIWQLLAQAKRDPIYRQIAVLAWGGYGKTTLLRHIAYTLGKNQQRQVQRYIPVLLLLRKYRELLSQDDAVDLPTLIETHHIPNLPGAEGLRMRTGWAREQLKQGKMLVMLDGFDEVPKAQRSLVARWVNAQMRTYRNSVFILTARPKAYTEQEGADRLDLNTLLWVRNFNAEQRRDFVEKWYWCQEYYHYGKTDTPAIRKEAAEAAADLLSQIEDRRELADLAKNPLLLNMIATFHRRYPSAKLPKRRVELYQEMCLLLLRDRPGARELETELVGCEAQTVLQMLALEMMQQKEERVDREILLERLTGYLESLEETVDAPTFLREIEQISELLVQRELEEFEFAHLSFQEYLAACEVARLKQESLLYDHFQEDWWKAVVLFYVGKVRKPAPLIRAALERGATDLAYTCWQETAKRVESELETQLVSLRQYELESELTTLKEEVQASRYQQLEEYLKNGQWEEAEKETCRLMIKTVGKEEGQFFSKFDLLSFPCEELSIIDGLWIQHSMGHFGFSVQKEIYINKKCGGFTDGKYYEEAWDKFCHEVGWKENGQYGSIKYTADTPTGHLPLLFSGISQVARSRFLFSRIQTCNL